MALSEFRKLLLLVTVTLLSGRQASFAQGKKPCEKDAKGIMICTIDLQGGRDFMEPKAEPTRIRVDDRASVRIHLTNLSPLDVCTLNGRTPAATAETPVGESIVGSIAKLGAFAISVAPQGGFYTEKIDLGIAKPEDTEFRYNKPR